MIRNTSRGYRYPLVLLFGGTVVASIALGSAGAAFGAGPRVDAFLMRHTPHYGIIVRHRADMWVRPAEGFLAGSVVKKEGDHFMLVDFKKGSIWQVYEIEGFVVRGGAVVEEGTAIKLIGEQGEEFVFYAREARPWGVGHEGAMQMMMEGMR